MTHNGALFRGDFGCHSRVSCGLCREVLNGVGADGVGVRFPISTCDTVEALLRHELLSHLPDWLSRKAGVLCCTSPHTILFMSWKEIFPNKDATRLDLVNELYALPVNMPTTMYQFASWLEDWMTKFVAADEVSAHIVGKPLQTTLLKEWTAR